MICITNDLHSDKSLLCSLEAEEETNNLSWFDAGDSKI